MAMPGADPVRKISIIPRGVAALGYTLQMPSEDRFLMTKAELEARIATLLGGRIAEEVVFGEISTGARDDLRKATDLARSMATLYGMSDAIGRVSYERDDRGQGFLGGGRSSDDASEATRREIDVEIRRILDAQYERARAILRGEEGALRRAAAVLLEREVISGEELLAVVEEHRRATRAGALGLSDS
jgi:cell division protease FtsH